jgi:hypothetical protein
MDKYATQLVLILILVGIHISASAQIYQYTNDSGRKIYVNRLSQVPAKYRDQLIKRKASVEKSSTTRQAAYELENKQFANSLALRNDISRLKKLREAMVTPVSIQGNQVIVPVQLKYAGRKSTLNLLLDTGASITVVHVNALPKFSTKYKKIAYAQVAGGGLIKTWPVALDSISYGPYNSEKKQVMVIEHKRPSNIDGLLGMDLLAGSQYKIDFSRQQIVWREKDFEEIEAQINSLKLQLK